MHASATLVISMADIADPNIFNSMMLVWSITPCNTLIGRRPNWQNKSNSLSSSVAVWEESDQIHPKKSQANVRYTL